MRPNITQGKRQIRGKKRPHWGILALDNPDKTNGKHSRLITEFTTQYPSDKKLGKDEPNQSSEDYSI